MAIVWGVPNFRIFTVMKDDTCHYVVLQWLEHLRGHGKMFETGVVVNNSARSGGIIRIYFLFSLTRRYVVCSHHRGNSNEYAQYTIFNIKRKSPKIIQNLQLWDFS